MSIRVADLTGGTDIPVCDRAMYSLIDSGAAEGSARGVSRADTDKTVCATTESGVCAADLPALTPALSQRERRKVVCEPWIDLRTVITLTRKELRDALRSRWLIVCAIAFAGLAIGVSYLSRVGTSMSGFSGFGPTAASLVNLVLLIVPLISLTAGASSIAAERERGTLAYVLAQPVTRLEVFLSKFAGLAIALLATLCVGFGACAIISPPGQLNIFLTLVGASAMLTIANLAIGLLISTIARKASAATGAGLLVWLAIVLLGDLGLMGSAVLFRLRASSVLLFGLVNPAQAFKLLVISSFDNTLDVLGPSGLYAVNTFGHGLSALLVGVLVAWTVLPLVVAGLVFARRPL